MLLSLVMSWLLAMPLTTAQLNKLAQKAGKLYFGTATDTGELSNTTYFKILTDKTEFGQLTPSNGMKWQFVEPQFGVFNYTEGEVVSKLATKNGDVLRCHNLVWHSQLAPWVEASTWTKENMTAMLKQHIWHEASHWKGQCYAWDVLNEALNDNGTYRETIFYKTLGPDYIPLIFKFAAEADPHAKLYYNDYNIESPGNKSTAVVEKILKPLIKSGIKNLAVGLQGHFVVGSTPTIDQQIATLKSYTSLGIEAAYTEIDIRMDLPDSAAKLEQQKQDYKTTIGACMQVERCVGMTVWDFYDPFSWVPGVFTGQGEPCLWFANFSKHPAYDGVVEALTNKTKDGCDPKPGHHPHRRSDRLY